MDVFRLADELVELLKRCQEAEQDAEESEHDMRRSTRSVAVDFLYDLKEFINEP